MEFSKMNTIFIISAILTALSCKKPTVEPSPPPTDSNSTTMAVEWFRPFYADSNGAYFESPFLSGNNVAFSARSPLGNTNAPGVGVYDRFTGEVHPSWQDEPGTNVSFDGLTDWLISSNQDHLALFRDDLGIYCYDVNSGSEKWSIDQYFNFRFNDFGDKLYCSSEIASSTIARLHEIDLQTGQMTTLLQMDAATQGGYEPSFESFTGWVAPWGDSVLIFQNRQYKFTGMGGAKTDLYAYNLAADTMLWKIDDLITGGNSSIQKPELAGNRLFFPGLLAMHCIDLVQGVEVWGREYNDLGFSSVPPLYANGVLFGRGQESVVAYDANTGNTLWRIDNEFGLQTDGRMGYYQGKLYFTGIDKTNTQTYPTYIFCLDASDGSVIWKENRLYDGSYEFNMAGGILIDQENGLLYANGVSHVACIDLNKTPL
jgi:outer membrane protein assembly factor BamB